MVQEAIRKADVLIEALPYIKTFHKTVFVIKYGGSILGEERVRKSVLEDIAFLRYTGIRPILVHGGGPNISERLKQLNIKSEFIDGMRVTDEITLNIVEDELNKLNDMIVDEINCHGALAQGFKRSDKLINAVKKDTQKDLGYVGDIINFDEHKLKEVMKTSIPVITPMGIGSDGTVYNINADDVAFYLATKLKAQKLVLLTNVVGIMRAKDDTKSLLPSLHVSEVEDLLKEGIISGGMIPKVKAGVQAIAEGVGKAHIIDAKIMHALLLEIFTNKGVGTEIVK
ncbi:MAG: acetylglutamate kinase [Candidatus Omnitrophica bacterium]|jgi:acetylglutamate kinase|nr:acetylglutamate kinase [Candidatus Omnitrophota bacterium]MDD5081247.1 acetylglutamate kinase [Candidatus Omnitrophota bacterium]MDD5441318.1 acetylglutamate kinase [Candidatus Omnitrophota bacterium]